ncbi:MAG: SRPBCC domain-containing protein [Fibrobacteres bacterium]|jgi:uncharacterized protein YndB with AHSA1/START domain|nr:SRPBCC domain-containing protein [Fibrobacterota bacterium]
MNLDDLYKPAPAAPALRVERLLARTPREVWTALLDPAHAARVWFGSTLESDLRPGGFLRWTGQWEGKSFEDHAIVVAIDDGAFLDALYFSGLSGLSETPETRLRLVIRLSRKGAGTEVVIEQANFPDDERRDHSVTGWNMILDAVEKDMVG